MSDQDHLRLVTYCGLYCGLCAQRARIPSQAQQLRQSLAEEGYDDWFQFIPAMKDTYPVFRQFLQNLVSFDCSCRSGRGGPPDCEIRNCAKSKGVDTCPLCDSYPCGLIEKFADRYPMLIQDGKRMKKVGVEKWVEEQEARAKKGFVYADARYEV